MEFIFEVLPKTRDFFKNVIEENSLETLNKIPDNFNNNIIWNIGHVLVTEQMLAYALSGLKPNVDETLIAKYRKGTKPEAPATQEEVDIIKNLLHSTIKQTQVDYEAGKFKGFQEYTVSTTGNTLKNFDDSLRFILFHEGLHGGYVMSLLHAVKGQ